MNAAWCVEVWESNKLESGQIVAWRHHLDDILIPGNIVIIRARAC